MYALICQLNARPDLRLWDHISGLLYQFHSQGIDEGEEPAPVGEDALHAANEFDLAIEPGLMLAPEKFTSYFKNRRDAEHAKRAIEAPLANFAPTYVIEEVEEKDYTALWRESFHPMAVAPFWLVRAPWHLPAASKDVKELIIEPGMAFGTGSHETTRACLELMAAAVQEVSLTDSTRVLDFGCGSGILSIGLKKLGVATVVGVDIDPLALDATRENSKQNGVEVITGRSVSPNELFDGIVANILKNTLLDFAQSFKAWLKPSGFLILSGLLAEQEQTIMTQYKALGFISKKRILNNGWISLWLSKP